MTAMDDGDLPRLPGARVEIDWTEQFEFEFGDTTGADQVGGAGWVPYDEPELLSLRTARRVVVITRAVLVAWVGTLVVAVIVARENALDGFDDGSVVTTVGMVGLVVAMCLSVGGWFWADRATQNLHRLSARLPSRTRCISAWMMPLGWAGLLAGTLLQLGPTEVVDIRPAILVTIFAAAMWRPYSLVRRIIRSSIPVDSDVLVASGYVLDLAVVLLLWWQLWTWPADLTRDNVGAAEVLLGLGTAALIAAGCSIVVWLLVLRDVDRALAHRTIAVRTRHDHKQLRLRGIDPMNPKVRLALLKLHREDAEQAQRDAEVRVDPGDPSSGLAVARAGSTAPSDETTSVQPRRVVEPDVVEPDVVEPDVVEPDVVEPDVVEPDVVEPDVVEPDVVEPDVVEPDVVEPDRRPLPIDRLASRFAADSVLGVPEREAVNGEVETRRYGCPFVDP